MWNLCRPSPCPWPALHNLVTSGRILRSGDTSSTHSPPCRFPSPPPACCSRRCSIPLRRCPWESAHWSWPPDFPPQLSPFPRLAVDMLVRSRASLLAVLKSMAIFVSFRAASSAASSWIPTCSTSPRLRQSALQAFDSRPHACPMHTLYLLFPLKSSWCHGRRTSAGRNGTVRRAGANPRRSTEFNVKRKLVAQPEINHEAAETVLRGQAPRTDEKFPCHENVLFCKRCGAVNAGGSLRLLKSLCDGSGESRQKARRKLERGLMPNEHVVADAKRAF